MKTGNFTFRDTNPLVILRIWTGILFIYSGKTFFDHSSMEHFADWLSQMKIPLPVFSAYLSKGTEFFGGILLSLGLFTKPVCLVHMINMLVATFIAKNGSVFEGGQLPFLLLVIVLTLFLSKDDISLDNLLFRSKLKSKTGEVRNERPI